MASRMPNGGHSAHLISGHVPPHYPLLIIGNQRPRCRISLKGRIRRDRHGCVQHLGPVSTCLLRRTEMSTREMSLLPLDSCSLLRGTRLILTASGKLYIPVVCQFLLTQHLQQSYSETVLAYRLSSCHQTQIVLLSRSRRSHQCLSGGDRRPCQR